MACAQVSRTSSGEGQCCLVRRGGIDTLLIIEDERVIEVTADGAFVRVVVSGRVENVAYCSRTDLIALKRTMARTWPAAL